MDHVAIDLGGRESQICIRQDNNEVRLEKRLATIKLKGFFKTLPPSRVIVETCAEAFAVAGDAKEAGHDVRVVPATLVRALGVGQRGIKTDVRDARCLSEDSVRIELGSVHVPSMLAREMKAVCTARDALVRSRTLLVNSVRAWMRGRLLALTTGATATFPGRVRACISVSEHELPPCLERQLVAIEALTEQVVACDLELRLIATTNEDCVRAMTVPGVGPATAVRFVGAIDDVSRFKTAHEVESYFGLTPGEHSSSDTKHRTPLTKAGSATVRWLLVQAAWTALRTRPNDPMVLWARRMSERKQNKFIAVVALARKIAGVLYALLRDQTNYQPQKGATARADDLDGRLIASGAGLTALARSGSPDAAVHATRASKKRTGSASKRGRTAG